MEEKKSPSTLYSLQLISDILSSNYFIYTVTNSCCIHAFLKVLKELGRLVSETLGQTELVKEDQAVPFLNQLLTHVPCLMSLCCMLQATTASCTGQEECREVGPKNSLQEPPLPPKGEQAVESKVNCLLVQYAIVIFSLLSPTQTTPARKPTRVKDDSFFGAFQGLSLDGLMGDSNGSPAAGDQCKVM